MCAWVVATALDHRGTPCQRQWELEIELLDSTPIHQWILLEKKDAMFPLLHPCMVYLPTLHLPFFLTVWEISRKRCKRIMDDDHVAMQVGTAQQNQPWMSQSFFQVCKPPICQGWKQRNNI